MRTQRGSGHPGPWGAQLREPSLLPAAKPRGAQWEGLGGAEKEDAAQITEVCPGGDGQNQNQNPWRQIWL